MRFLLGAQIIISVLIVVVILLQRGDSGLGTVFGGSVTDTFRTRRGFEAFLFNFTIFLVVMLAANAMAIVILNSV